MLRTRRLILAPLEMVHADQLVGLLDPRVHEHFPPEDAIQTLAQLRAQFSALTNFNANPPPGRRLINLVVAQITSSVLIGRLEALVQGTDAELAFVFIPEVWGEGYAAEAVGALQKFLASEEGVERFWTSITPTNARSIALCTRLGFEPSLPETWPDLATYDEGDVVRSMAASHRLAS